MIFSTDFFPVTVDSNLKIGDIIVEINREEILNTNSFIKILEKIKQTGRLSILLRIERDDKFLFITNKFKDNWSKLFIL